MTPSESSAPSPLPYRDRKIGLVVFGLLTVFGGLCCVLFLVLILFAQTLAAKQGTRPSPHGSLGMIATLYGGGAVALCWLGIASMMARRWARALLLIGSRSWLISGSVATLISAETLKKVFAVGALNATSTAVTSPPNPALAYWIAIAFLGIFGVLLPFHVDAFLPQPQCSRDVRSARSSRTLDRSLSLAGPGGVGLVGFQRRHVSGARL